MSKAIKTVKSKGQLKRLLENTTGTGRELLEQWIALDPIYVGEPTSADYKQSIHRHLIESTKQIRIPGHWCEFGVREGRSLKWLIEEYPTQVIHAFDSWEGLPEEWNHGTGTVDDMSCTPPEVPDHTNNPGPVSFLHMDADIYSSTKEVLGSLDDQIVPGTVITFDEFCNFRLSGKMSKWQDQEFLALVEWLDQFAREIKPLNRNWAYQASCVVIKFR